MMNLNQIKWKHAVGDQGVIESDPYTLVARIVLCE